MDKGNNINFLQCQKRDLGPNQNDQLTTAEITLIIRKSDKNKIKTWQTKNEIQVKTLMMPIVAAEAFSVVSSEPRQRRVTCRSVETVNTKKKTYHVS